VKLRREKPRKRKRAIRAAPVPEAAPAVKHEHPAAKPIRPPAWRMVYDAVTHRAVMVSDAAEISGTGEARRWRGKREPIP
jgi:hypothetical protein